MFGTYQRLRVHVGASWREVIRAARLKVAPEHRTSRAVRDDRHRFYRVMLSYHVKARKLARGVI